ncbi:MAG: serine protease [Chloroflexi bacterium]|nr:serine protease [Chloroflexota bacterium]MYK34347.1 serine protease [Chloroflexota bacterium]
MHNLTGRAVILYSSAWLEARDLPPATVSISLQDMVGFMEVVSNVEEDELDLIVHSPGGSAEAAEAIVEYLRTRFKHVRAFVPLAAMSAATMIALSADEIVMGDHSQLGPQFQIATPEGPRAAPAKAILDQFEHAKRECRDPANLAAWMPILRSYAPGLLAQCEDSRELAEGMVSQWLADYMFQGEADREEKAKRVAAWFADYDSFQSHGRRVGPQPARNQGVHVTRLEDDHDLQDAVLSVHHAAMHTFSNTMSAKIVENHHGRAWVQSRRDMLVPGPSIPIPVPAPQNPPNRAARRRQQRGRQ